MHTESLNDLYVDELRDLYDAQRQIRETLPRRVETASDSELKEALHDHLEVTNRQIGRLDEIFDHLGVSKNDKTCIGMQGLIEEGDRVIASFNDPNVRDAAIIGVTQKVEHYEIAGFGTARTWADLLGYDEAADMLDECADEAGDADERLTDIATGGIFTSGVNEAARQDH